MKKTGAKRKDIPSQIKGRHIKTNVQIFKDGENIMTFGEKAVGITFNPGGKAEVSNIKTLSAALIDELDKQRSTVTGESAEQFTLAIRKIQEGQMWGVKAATWNW